MNPTECAATDRRRRLDLGPADRRLFFPVCDKQTPKAKAGADQAKGAP